MTQVQQLPTRPLSIEALKTRLDEMDKEINIKRAERARLGFEFNQRLIDAARNAPREVQPQRPEVPVITGFEDSPMRRK